MAIFHIGQRLSLVLELAFRLTFSRDINVAFLVFLLSYKTYMRLKCSVEVYNHIAGIFFFFFQKTAFVSYEGGAVGTCSALIFEMKDSKAKDRYISVSVYSQQSLFFYEQKCTALRKTRAASTVWLLHPLSCCSRIRIDCFN